MMGTTTGERVSLNNRKCLKLFVETTSRKIYFELRILFQTTFEWKLSAKVKKFKIKASCRQKLKIAVAISCSHSKGRKLLQNMQEIVLQCRIAITTACNCVESFRVSFAVI